MDTGERGTNLFHAIMGAPEDTDAPGTVLARLILNQPERARARAEITVERL